MRSGLLIAIAVVTGCVSNPQEPNYALDSIADAAHDLNACEEVFQSRIAKSLQGQLFTGVNRRDVAQKVFFALPTDERTALADAAAALPPKESAESVREFLRRDFADRQICGDLVLESQIELFANSLNLYLIAHGLSTDTIFTENGATTSGRGTQAQILHSLVDAARRHSR